MIDLKKVFSMYPDAKNNSARLFAILKDVFPDEKKRSINIIVRLMDSGYVNRIIGIKSLAEKDLFLLISDIENEYGFKEEYILDAIYQWADAYDISYQKVSLVVADNENKQDNRKLVNTLSNVIIDNELMTLSLMKVKDTDKYHPMGVFSFTNKSQHIIRLLEGRAFLNGMTFEINVFEDFDPNSSRFFQLYLPARDEVQLCGYNSYDEIKSLEMQFSYRLDKDYRNINKTEKKNVFMNYS